MPRENRAPSFLPPPLGEGDHAKRGGGGGQPRRRRELMFSPRTFAGAGVDLFQLSPAAASFLRPAIRRAHAPSHPVGGEGVGSTASTTAGCGRAMKPGGGVLRGSSRASVWMTPLARRRPRGGPLRLYARKSTLPEPPQGGTGRAFKASRKGPAVGGAGGKRSRGALRLVETVYPTHRPGEPRRPAPFPPPLPPKRRRVVPVVPN